MRDDLTDAAIRLGKAANYRGAGTVEFLLDADTDKFYFIEVNPRIQVEHTVTEVVTGIDIVKAQIHLLEGAVIGTPESGVPLQEDIRLNGNAIQCRITTEDPEENFIPDYGRITAYREATGFGVRLDGGTAYAGRDHHAVLRSAAREGHLLGAGAGGGDRPHASRAARVPHPRRATPISPSSKTSSRIRISSTTATRRGSSTRRRSCSTFSAARTGRRSC